MIKQSMINEYILIEAVVPYIVNHSHYLYKCDYLIPVHIHPCNHNNSFQQY